MPIQPDFPASEAGTLKALQQLIEVVAKLRNPDGGCPWDLAQTARSLTPYIIEEAYETVHAIQSGDQSEIAEELGDLLLQVILQAQVAQDEQQFDLAFVVQQITEKMIRRHPHVFGDMVVADADAVNQNWEAIKAKEKGLDQNAQTLSEKLGHKAKSLPALEAGMKISQKAAKAGFEWENIDGVWDKFYEELDEFRHALKHETSAEQTAEFGDLMFSLLQLARWTGIDPSEALAGTNQRFIQRLQKMEQFADRPLETYCLEELETLWQQAKQKLGQGSSDV
ncbi:nucleoside triphosphate pyrophosphohydrolase [filamentous cyanobacterium LEGE 11480]|uniref:Nucleoside triphosphate pyrophosphohydrolase n=1 Tax=Romeriopsis navalis LEGE 11480 TaxID=2777977 RepID=A0A928Z4W6_9CYAN|nr:nucleoside triphosphate pyrophosphohydrolase [Romeriopsis navalis]MBE9030828.1 nucleoside triphosphate pyrophosphohydrolase [Romeriopsis navalis LEGE 11480]